MEKNCLAETDQIHLILLGIQLNYIHQTIVDYLHLTHIYIRDYTLEIIYLFLTHEMNRSEEIKNVTFLYFFSLLFV